MKEKVKLKTFLLVADNNTMSRTNNINLKPNQKGAHMQAELITSFTNKEDAIMSKVVKMSKGYSVTLWDTDENEALPSATIFNSKSDAITFAQSLI